MAVRRLNHAVLYVHDLASAVDFYTATLGFEVRAEMAGRAAFLRAPGSANDHDLEAECRGVEIDRAGEIVNVEDGVVETAHGHGRLLFAMKLYPPSKRGVPR